MADINTTDPLKSKIDACRKKRKDLVEGVWRDNVSFRVQKPFGASDDGESAQGPDQIAVPADWTRTRSKAAALFSHMPRITLTAKHSRWAAAVPKLETIVNYWVPRAGAAAVMDECLADVINAAGLCAAFVQYEATFEDVPMSTRDPLAAQLAPSAPLAPPSDPGMGAGPVGGAPGIPGAQPDPTGPAPVSPTDDTATPDATAGAAAGPQSSPAPGPMGSPAPAAAPEQITVPRPVDERWRWYRIAPGQLLWDVDNFKGSDWQRNSFLGYDGVAPWPVAKAQFKLKDSQKDAVCGSDDKNIQQLAENDKIKTDKGMVHFTRVFFWKHIFDATEKRFDAIGTKVWVNGIDEPVVSEDYAGQQWSDQHRSFLGCTRLPIEVATLTYVSDLPVPPSDSEIGRPQVLEQIRSRSEIVMQRTRNLPIRTFDVNRIDPMIADLLQRGTWQGLIPTQGPGDRVLSQIAAAAFPAEDFAFDKISNRDLDDAWSMGPNQNGNFATGERSASEANIVSGAFQTVIGAQREKIVAFFLGLVETTMGLLQLNLDQWDEEPIVGKDGVQQLQEYNRKDIDGRFIATVRQDSTVLRDSQQRLAELIKTLNLVGKSGFVNVQPIIAEIVSLSGLDPAQVVIQPKPPAPAPPNISARFNGDDFNNPYVVALVQKQQSITSHEIDDAKMLIADCQTPSQPPPGAPPAQNTQPNPDDWQAQPRVTKRPDEIGG